MAGYSPISGIEFKDSYEEDKMSFYNNIEIKYQINLLDESGYTKQLIDKAIYTSSALSLNEIKRLDGVMPKYDKNDYIEIYEVTEAELNNQGRFPVDYIKSLLPNDRALWGYYDPRISESEIDSIIISSHGTESNFKIVVHEIAHYWYEAYRIDRLGKISSEDFALKVQEQSNWQNQ